MYNLKPLIFSCLCSTPLSRADDIFSAMMASMNQHMLDMEEDMKRMQDMMQSQQGLRKNSTITYDIADNDKNVLVQFKGISSDEEPRATMGDTGNHLSIHFSHGTINLRTRDRLLTVEINHKEEQTQDTKGRISSAVSISSSSSSQLLSNKALAGF